MKSIHLLLAFAVTTLTGAVRCRAALLASYNFDSASPQASAPTEPGSSAWDFLYGPGINGGTFRTSSYAATSGANSINMLGNETDGTDVAGTVAAGDYWTFTVTATGGTLLNLDTLTFRYGGSANITSNIFVRSSADGFANNIAFSTSETVLTYTVDGGSTGSFTASPASIPLPGHQNLSEITFRIYGYDTSGSSGTGGIRLDDVILNGSVIPEPSPSLLLVGCLVPSILLRKRTR